MIISVLSVALIIFIIYSYYLQGRNKVFINTIVRLEYDITLLNNRETKLNSDISILNKNKDEASSYIFEIESDIKKYKNSMREFRKIVSDYKRDVNSLHHKLKLSNDREDYHRDNSQEKSKIIKSLKIEITNLKKIGKKN